MVKLDVGEQNLFDKKEKNQKIVHESAIMKELVREVKKIGKLPSPVLILGENGSGRKMIAREVFYNSRDNNERLIIFNPAGMNVNLMDSYLFGSGHKDYLSNIENKTLLIENIDIFPTGIQSKLLRFLQEKNKIDGTNKYRFRIICTANDLLSKKVENGEFREDLFRYLSQSLLIVPSLVEREEDILQLVSIFLSDSGFKGTLTKEAMNKLKNHSWKGNVIELKNICFQIATLYNGQMISEDQIPIMSSKNLDLSLFVKYHPKINLEDLVNYYISQSLKHFKSKKKSAESLNISVKTIYNKIESGAVKSNQA